ncbi:MAG: peptidylprolyl isomerase [Pirellulales bacterium]|nr:peptidylprolyl isomerase [Pirellulales bacterium]
MPIKFGLCLLLFSLSATYPVLGQDAPKTVENSSPAEQFESIRTEWAQFALELDKARFRVNNCPPDQKNEAVLAYDTLLEQGNQLLQRFADSTVTAYEADPDHAEAARYLTIMIEHTLAADRYELVVRMAKAMIEHGKPDAKLYEQAGIACFELGALDDAEKFFAEAAKLGDLSNDAKSRHDSIPEWREKLARETKLREAEAAADNLPRVTITTTKGDIVLELYEDQAPNAVANFIGLVDRKFYNGLEFFRVQNNFAAVAGCPLNRGTGGPGHEILCETDRDDRRAAMRGTISMANAGRGRCGSLFFISLASSGVNHSEANNPVFGRVLSGMDVVERLKRADPDTTSKDFARDRILDTKVERRRPHEYVPVTTYDIGKAKEAEAVVLLREGNYDEAERLLAEGLEVAPWWYNLRYRMGVLQLERGRAAEAIPHLSRAARMAPREPDPHLYLAMAYAKAGDSTNAKLNFEKVLKLRPTDGQAMKGLGIVLMTERRFRQAIEMFEQALEVNPKDTEAQGYINRAGELLNQQRAGK